MAGDRPDPGGASERVDSRSDGAGPPDVEAIRGRELADALARLERRGPVTDRKRAIVADLSRSLTSAVGPAAVAAVRAARAGDRRPAGDAGGGREP